MEKGSAPRIGVIHDMRRDAQQLIVQVRRAINAKLADTKTITNKAGVELDIPRKLFQRVTKASSRRTGQRDVYTAEDVLAEAYMEYREAKQEYIDVKGYACEDMKMLDTHSHLINSLYCPEMNGPSPNNVVLSTVISAVASLVTTDLYGYYDGEQAIEGLKKFNDAAMRSCEVYIEPEPPVSYVPAGAVQDNHAAQDHLFEARLFDQLDQFNHQEDDTFKYASQAAVVLPFRVLAQAVTSNHQQAQATLGIPTLQNQNASPATTSDDQAGHIKMIIREKQHAMPARNIIPDSRACIGNLKRITTLGYMQHCEALIFLGPHFVKLRCHHCGTNANKKSGRYYKGIGGFQDHIVRYHNRLGLSEEEIIKHCSDGDIQFEEVRSAMEGHGGVGSLVAKIYADAGKLLAFLLILLGEWY